MLAFLEIARAAFVSLGRRFGPWMLGLVTASLVARHENPKLDSFWFGFVSVLLIVFGIPLMAGSAARRWVGGVLNVVRPSSSTPHAYALGASLLFVPAVLAICSQFIVADLGLFGLLALVTTWIGAAVGTATRRAATLMVATWLSLFLGAFAVGVAQGFVVTATDGLTYSTRETFRDATMFVMPMLFAALFAAKAWRTRSTRARGFTLF